MKMCRFFFGSMSIGGVEIKAIFTSHVGGKFPARLLCVAEGHSEEEHSEIVEVAHSEADAFQNFGFVLLPQ